MFKIKSTTSDITRDKNGNKKVRKSSLDEAFEMLDKPKSSLTNCSISSDSSSETSEMAALVEAAVVEGNEKKKPQKIKLIKQDKNKARILTSLIIPSDDSSRKRLAKAPNKSVNSELEAKRAKILSALSAANTPSKIIDNKKSTTTTVVQNSLQKTSNTLGNTPRPPAKMISVPVQPVNIKPQIVSSTLVGGRSSIHGRKTMSIREQQEKICKKNISELVMRLKAENELEKTKKPIRRQEISQNRRGTHAAAFGALQSASRLPFILDDDESTSTEVIA